MGKRNRKSRAPAAPDADGGMPRALRKETLEIVNLLLEKCSNPFGAKGKEWEEYVEVHNLVEKLRKKQTNYVLMHPDREQGFPAFISWLQQYGVKTDSVTIEKFDVGDYGLKANRDVQASELLFSVPYKLMLTTLTAKSSVLGPLIKGDRMLQAMPNVSLSLHVLCEKASGSSPWAPYINILPHSYCTPLYFTQEEVLLLKGSPAFTEALNQFRNISRQYAYFFKQFQALDDVLKLPIRNMCFDDYRWAVSTVMTRQNQIPNRRGEQTVLSLIPLWDMLNHDNGHITTDYDLKKDCTQSYALRDFKKGEQLFIFYGERTNAEFLINNGFIYAENHHDKLSIKLGISKNDHLYAMKSEVLSRLSLVPSRVFGLLAGSDPVDLALVAYLRVFNMHQGELDARLRGEKSSKLVHQLRDLGLLVSVENEKKCWNFLETRVKLLLRTYPTTKQEDEALLSQSTEKLTDHAKMAIQLRMSEKQILENTAEFARLQRDEVDELVRQHLEQISLGMNDLEMGTAQAAINDVKDDNDGDELEGLKLNPDNDWDIKRGVEIEEIEDDSDLVTKQSDQSKVVRQEIITQPATNIGQNEVGQNAQPIVEDGQTLAKTEQPVASEAKSSGVLETTAQRDVKGDKGDLKVTKEAACKPDLPLPDGKPDGEPAAKNEQPKPTAKEPSAKPAPVANEGQHEAKSNGVLETTAQRDVKGDKGDPKVTEEVAKKPSAEPAQDITSEKTEPAKEKEQQQELPAAAATTDGLESNGNSAVPIVLSEID